MVILYDVHEFMLINFTTHVIVYQLLERFLSVTIHHVIHIRKFFEKILVFVSG